MIVRAHVTMEVTVRIDSLDACPLSETVLTDDEAAKKIAKEMIGRLISPGVHINEMEVDSMYTI